MRREGNHGDMGGMRSETGFMLRYVRRVFESVFGYLLDRRWAAINPVSHPAKRHTPLPNLGNGVQAM
jgi:hypothetical protein